MTTSILQADAKRQGDASLLRDVGRISSIIAAASPPTEGKLILPFWTDFVIGGGVEGDNMAAGSGTLAWKHA